MPGPMLRLELLYVYNSDQILLCQTKAYFFPTNYFLLFALPADLVCIRITDNEFAGAS